MQRIINKYNNNGTINTKNLINIKHLNSEKKKNLENNLCNIGSCGLYIVHRAFKTGMKSQGLKIDQVFKSVFGIYLSPARQYIFGKLMKLINP